MSEIGDFRKSKDQYFGGDPNSPLTPEQRKGFKGLKYFAENADLQFVLEVEEYPDDPKDLIQMATSSGIQRHTSVGATLGSLWAVCRSP